MNKNLWIFCVAVIALSVPVNATAATEGKKSSITKVSEPSMKTFGKKFEEGYRTPRADKSLPTPLWMMGKMIFYSALVIFTLYVFLKFLKTKKKFLTGESPYLSLLQTIPIAPNRYLGIVDIAGTLIVVGITEQNIQTLYEIKDREKADQIRLSFQKKVTGNHFFQELANKLGISASQVEDTANENKALASIVSERQEQLRRM